MLKRVLVLGGTALFVIFLYVTFGVGFRAERAPRSANDLMERKAMRNFGGDSDEGYMGKRDAPMKSAPKGHLADAPAAPPPAEAPAAGFGGLGLVGSGEGGGGTGERTRALQQKRFNTIQVIRGPKDEKKELAEGESGGEGAQGAPTRAWFPETFLFEPLVVTDEKGEATVPVKVPDRLTSWRVLALAHSRQGGQAGAVTSFLGTLPTYVDPVVPPFLLAGDQVRLPVQMVNTTSADVATQLSVDAMNATVSSHGGPVRVPAGGSSLQYVELKAPHPGTTTLRAALGSTDAVERSIDVKPQGKPKAVSAGGTLGAPRSLTLDGPAEPLEGSEHVSLQVFPGALALVRSELAAAPGRGGVAEDAYTLLLLGRAPELLHSLGADPDNAVIRDLSLLASQRALHEARSPSVPDAVLLAEAALSHPESPVLMRLGERLAAQVARAQRPDGTCEGATGWTLQRLLVTTAGCVRAVSAAHDTPEQKQRAVAVTVKAAGAFERSLGRVDDGYTAAALLASGAAESMREKLEALVLRDLAADPDGSKHLEVATGVVRADGEKPSVAEATALSVLALQKNDKAPVADLGSWLLGHYSPVWGWGDGEANLWALRAVTSLFKEKVPAGVKVSLLRDGKPVLEGTLDAAKLLDVLSLDAPAVGSAGKHEWTVKAEPAVAGLGFSLTLQAYVPWKDEPGGGLELQVKQPPKLQVGEPADLELTAAATANVPVKLRLALPAGVQHDSPSLDALVSQGTVTRYETEDGAVTLHLRPLTAGASFTGKLKVVPTLAGTLHAAANTMSPEDRPQLARDFAPATWVVR